MHNPSVSMHKLQHLVPHILTKQLSPKIKMQTYRHKDIQTYRHTDIQTYRHKDTQTHRHTDRHTDIQTYRHTEIQTYRHTDIQTYRHTDIHFSPHACPRTSGGKTALVLYTKNLPKESKSSLTKRQKKADRHRDRETYTRILTHISHSCHRSRLSRKSVRTENMFGCFFDARAI